MPNYSRYDNMYISFCGYEWPLMSQDSDDNTPILFSPKNNPSKFLHKFFLYDVHPSKPTKEELEQFKHFRKEVE